MTIKCPQNLRTIHRRKPQKREKVFFGTDARTILCSNDAEQIYFAVQKMYDRLDVTQEINDRMEEGSLSTAEGRKLLRRAGEIADRYRDWLDDDPHRDHVLCHVLYEEQRRL